jgi:hypothetical protein
MFNLPGIGPVTPQWVSTIDQEYCLKNLVPGFRPSSRVLASICIGGAIGAFGLSGCASIMHGTRQDIGIASSPSGADVWIDNIRMGQTPVVERLKRNSSDVVKISMPGYQPFETTITHSVSGWVWGNVAIGGLIGLGVDAISGGIYKLSPEQVTGELRANLSEVPASHDDVAVKVALHPESGWVKVGQLQRAL